MKIKWSPYRSLDENSSWLGMYKEKFIDLMKIGDLWHAAYDNKPIVFNVATRDKAVEELEEMIHSGEI